MNIRLFIAVTALCFGSCTISFDPTTNKPSVSAQITAQDALAAYKLFKNHGYSKD